MSSPEQLPKPAYDREKNEAARAHEIVNIIDSSLLLIEALKSHQPPDRAQSFFDFPVDFSAPLMLPETIRQWQFTHSLSSVQMTLSHVRDEPMMGIGIDFYDDNDEVLSLSRKPNGITPPSHIDVIANPHKINPDSICEGNPYPGTTHYKIANDEVNQLIISMLGINHGQPLVSLHDLHYEDRFDSLSDALSGTAYASFFSAEYELDAEIEYIAYTERSGDLQTLTVTYAENAKEKISMYVDLQEGMKVDFECRSEDSSKLFIPNLDELHKFNQTNLHAYEAIKSPDTISLEDIAETRVDSDDNYL